MKILEVPFLNVGMSDLQQIDLLMTALPLQPINNNPWPEFITSAEAGFTIGHANDAILIQYKVKEENLRSFSRDFNENVHLDNCVEFFIGFGLTDAYYNIELNCLGSIKVGYGKGRNSRTYLEPDLLKNIRLKTHMVYLPNTGKHSFEWELLVYIPVSIFYFDDITKLEGCVARGNFYKCGDELPVPHFLTWNAIDTPSPDFHRPEFFGELIFGKL